MTALLQTTKEIGLEFTNSLWNDKNFAAIDEFIDENIVIHSSIGDFHGIPAFVTLAKTWLSAFPDLHVQDNIVICEDEMMSILWKTTGTHLGEFKGRAPTGKSVSYNGVTIYRIKNNKIVEYFACLDMENLLRQL